jgi:hypothetical protein
LTGKRGFIFFTLDSKRAGDTPKTSVIPVYSRSEAKGCKTGTQSLNFKATD